MKIFINGRFLTQKFSGVQKFSYEITKELVQNSNHDITVLVPKNHEINHLYRINFKIRYIGLFYGHLWEQISLPLFLSRKGEHLLLNFSNSAPIFSFNNFITIHDLSIYKDSTWFDFFYYHYYKILLPIIVRRAKQIITVSEFSKNEIIKKFSIQKNSIHVVYNGLSSFFLTKESIEKENNSILFVGSMNNRKNLNIIIDLVYELPDFTFNLVGVNQEDFNKKFPLYRNNIQIKCLGNVYESKLTELYNSSKFFINPSLYEGFGLPIIEAFSRECVVLSSNIDVFHEICDDAAIYFNPNDGKDLLNKINKLVENKNQCDKLIQLAKNRLKLFNWHVETKKIIKLIQKI